MSRDTSVIIVIYIYIYDIRTYTDKYKMGSM